MHKASVTGHVEPPTGCISSFHVTGLFGHRDFEIVIDDNTLVLVGENGIGKSTVLRLLYYFLSGAWIRLASYEFLGISATIDGTEFSVKRTDLESVPSEGLDELQNLPRHIRVRLQELALEGEGAGSTTELEVRELALRFGVPIALLRSAWEKLSASPSLPESLVKAQLEISEIVKAQVLYLPTYRRIELELREIFPDWDLERNLLRRRNFERSEAAKSYIELVEFGMRDVSRAIDRTLEQLKEFARTGLNGLSLRYLGDVVDSAYEDVSVEDLANVPYEKVAAVVERVDNSILSREHKQKIMTLITDAPKNARPSAADKIVYHYFSKLLDFQKSLQEKEKGITEFCTLCSEYLVGKRLVYDSAEFSFSIIPSDDASQDEQLRLRDLSSGEKQIVSLFSHMYLSSAHGFLVLIDEPELSLSVDWQRRFLRDIWKGEFCKGLFAVTHSPFVFDNELDTYTHALGEFMVPSEYRK